MHKGMIPITRAIVIDEKEIQESFVRASGPGGQSVNKVSTAVQLRFDIRHSPSLPEDVRERLIRLAGRRMHENGVWVIEARRFRTQERNRQDARERLIQLIRQAATKPKVRRKTQPTLPSKKRRLESKRHRSQIKRRRGSIRSWFD